MPDGCQDLICKHVAGEPPHWFISPLYDMPKKVNIAAQSSMFGFRLQPGTSIDEASLLGSLMPHSLEIKEVADRIETFTSRSSQAVEILDCLSQDAMSVQRAASNLGVHIRSLQRCIVKETGRTATYWIRLARVRRAARALQDNAPLLEIAYTFGFSDQSHMTREFQHWFGYPPKIVRSQPKLLQILASNGYG